MSDAPVFHAPDDEDLTDLPDPNGNPNMVGEILPTDLEVPDGDR